MTDQQQRLQAFVKLGDFFSQYCEYANNRALKLADRDSNLLQLDENIELAGNKNGWFTRENIEFSLKTWSTLLTAENLEKWLMPYDLQKNTPKKVAIIMAGNIPLVGFHDFLCTLITGNRAMVKLSSNDSILLPFIANYLSQAAPCLKASFSFPEGRLDGFDAVIATGSNNTTRYFEYYFGHKPHIIRKNRVSIAILTDGQSPETLRALGDDIFRYYGLGCRSVSKLFVPEGYDFDAFFNAVYPYHSIMDHQKYINNYDYNKAVYLMSEFKILDNGFLMLKEDANYGSPIATLFYEYYKSPEDLLERINTDRDQLQCVVAQGLLPGEIPFGETQIPGLQEYADGMDTIEFLLQAQ